MYADAEQANNVEMLFFISQNGPQVWDYFVPWVNLADVYFGILGIMDSPPFSFLIRSMHMHWFKMDEGSTNENFISLIKTE